MRMLDQEERCIRCAISTRSAVFAFRPGPLALLDLPWLPVYLLLVFLLHPLLGLLATVGALVLVGFTALTELRSSAPACRAPRQSSARQNFMDAARRNAEIIQAMGLDRRMAGRWHDA